MLRILYPKIGILYPVATGGRMPESKPYVPADVQMNEFTSEPLSSDF